VFAMSLSDGSKHTRIFIPKLRDTQLCKHGPEHREQEGSTGGYAHDLCRLRLLSFEYTGRWECGLVDRFIGQAMSPASRRMVDRYVRDHRDGGRRMPPWAHAFIWLFEDHPLDYRPDLGLFGVRDDWQILRSMAPAHIPDPMEMQGFSEKLSRRAAMLSSHHIPRAISYYNCRHSSPWRTPPIPLPPKALPVPVQVPPPPPIPVAMSQRTLPPVSQSVSPLCWLGGPSPSSIAESELVCSIRVLESVASSSAAGDCASISEFVDHAALDALPSLEEEPPYVGDTDEGQWL